MNKSKHWTEGMDPVIKASLEVTEIQDIYQSQKNIYKYLFSKGVQFESVVDFGCGLGRWLSAAVDLGVSDIRGYDIPEVPIEERLISADKFHSADLGLPQAVDRKFDLAVSTEVAEHIDPANISTFIDNICNFSEQVLFTAAPPYQGGAGHCNENWIEYWVWHFKQKGYHAYDFIRDDCWNDASIKYYFRQNILFFASDSQHEKLSKVGIQKTSNPKSLIHPEMYLKAIDRSRPSSQSALHRDVEIYYSHIKSLKENRPLDSFSHGYGKDIVFFEDILNSHSNQSPTKNNEPEKKSLLNRAKNKMKLIFDKIL